MPKIFGREPAAWLGLFAVLVQLASTFFLHLTTDQQSLINAVAAGVAGLVVAVLVHDGVVAAVGALFQSAMALAVGFGLQWTPDKQSVFMALVMAAVHAFVRTQVQAPVSAPVKLSGV